MVYQRKSESVTYQQTGTELGKQKTETSEGFLITTNKSLTMAVIIMKLTEFADRIWGIEKPPNFTKLISFLLCRTHFGEVPQLIMAASTRLTCVDWFYLVKIIL